MVSQRELVDLIASVTLEVLRELESSSSKAEIQPPVPVGPSPTPPGPPPSPPTAVSLTATATSSVNGYSDGYGDQGSSTCANGEECNSCAQCVSRNPDAVQQIVDSGASRIGQSPGLVTVPGNLAWMIDHTLLKPEATEEDLRKLCREGRQYGFASVCVNSANVSFCVSELAGSGVKVCAVVGFPLGASTPEVKAYETAQAIRDGAREIDMVINVGALKNGDFGLIFEDIYRVVKSASGAIVKVIHETGLLDYDQKVIACALSKAAGADYVKTSTGMGKGGATIEDIELMRRIVGPKMGVKASGGIRDTQTAQAMIKAGATRIGASASVGIVQGSTQQD